jgi:hypothetical protein
MVDAVATAERVPVYRGNRGKGGRVNRMGPLAVAAAQAGQHGGPGWSWVRSMAGPQASAILMRRKSTPPGRPSSRSCRRTASRPSPGRTRRRGPTPKARAPALAQPASYDDIATLWGCKPGGTSWPRRGG